MAAGLAERDAPPSPPALPPLPLRQARELAGPAPRALSLVRPRPAAWPLAEPMHTLPPPLGLMGAVGADLRGRPEEDSACEEGAGGRIRDPQGGRRDQEERRRRPGLGDQGCGMETENQNRA